MSVMAVKFGFGFVAAVALFEALQARVVLNAMMLFVTAGIVPGTNIVLSPDATMVTVIATLLGVVLLWNRRRIMLGLRDPHMELEQPASIVAVRMSSFTLPRPRKPRRALLAARVVRSTVTKGLWAAIRTAAILELSLEMRSIIFRKRLGISIKRLDAVVLVLGEWVERIPPVMRNAWVSYKPVVYAGLVRLRASFDRWLSSE